MIEVGVLFTLPYFTFPICSYTLQRLLPMIEAVEEKRIEGMKKRKKKRKEGRKDGRKEGREAKKGK